MHLAGVSQLWPAGCTWLRVVMNVAQHKIINLIKMLQDIFVTTCCNVFNMWPKKTLLLPWWPEMTEGWTPLCA